MTDKIKDRINAIRQRKLKGYAPHNLLNMHINLSIKKGKDIFDIDRIKWKEIDTAKD